LKDAFQIIGEIVGSIMSGSLISLAPATFSLAVEDVFLLSLFIFALFWLEQKKRIFAKPITSWWFRLFYFPALFWIVMIWGSFDNKQFIYFQF